MTLADRIRRSFLASVGSIVFGMEDGTVSIFGLVFGVAVSAPDSRAVLLAGGYRRGRRCGVDDGGHVPRRGVDQ